ncbi:hypothetical protein R1sor_025988 [Riccia sorocarpa]|uniref:Uncharacterized protein n=1 Tax=Riccia sorocarpa TaxID=122646 RepID=A0ABD3GD69_9MARC
MALMMEPGRTEPLTEEEAADLAAIEAIRESSVVELKVRIISSCISLSEQILGNHNIPGVPDFFVVATGTSFRDKFLKKWSPP